MKCCPKCNSKETYRKHPHDLKIYCDRCGYSWEAEQVLKPLLEQKVYVRKSDYYPRGTHTVMVWLCPSDRSKYSFSVSYSMPLIFDEFENNPYLSGCYDSLQAALNAGIAEVKK